MADVRSLLRNERASRRINHPLASYTDAGKLTCAICLTPIKTESLWENHIKSPQHTLRLEHVRANPPQSQGKKRKAADTSYEDRKRVKGVPEGFVPQGFFDQGDKEAQGEEEGPEQETLPLLQAAPVPVPAAAPAPQPEVNEDEWAAFERDMAQADQLPITAVTASATISAAPVSAEELAAQARQEQSTQRGAREAEIEADNEDAARALEEEFAEMEDLDERVRKLREKREALRLANQPDTLPDYEPPPVTAPEGRREEDKGDDDDEDDDYDDEFDDWNFGAR